MATRPPPASEHSANMGLSQEPSKPPGSLAYLHFVTKHRSGVPKPQWGTAHICGELTLRVMLTHTGEEQANERDFVRQLLNPKLSAREGTCQYSSPVKAFRFCFCSARLPGLSSVHWQGDVPEFQGCGQ